MSAVRRPGMGSRAAVVFAAFLLAACGPNPAPTPVVPPASPATSASAPATGDLALEACDVTGYVPCEHQATQLAVPVAGTGVTLTYSSEWAPGRKDRTGWDASAIGLGGWSLDIVQRYDPAASVLLSGDGSWRFAKGVTLPSGERVVPTYDGLRAYVFDAKGRHVRTVDALLGATLVTLSYDAGGRLLGADGSLDSAPIHLVVEREADGTLAGLVGLDGARTPLFLDSTGPLGAIQDPAGRNTVFTYGADGLLTTYNGPTGGVTTYAYDDAGRLISEKDPDGVTQTTVTIRSACRPFGRATPTCDERDAERHERCSGNKGHRIRGRPQCELARGRGRRGRVRQAAGARGVSPASRARRPRGSRPAPKYRHDQDLTSPPSSIQSGRRPPRRPPGSPGRSSRRSFSCSSTPARGRCAARRITPIIDRKVRSHANAAREYPLPHLPRREPPPTTPQPAAMGRAVSAQ